MRFVCRECVSLFTRVCSRASSASTQNSLTEPGRSESLQTFPVNSDQRETVSVTGSQYIQMYTQCVCVCVFNHYTSLLEMLRGQVSVCVLSPVR